MGEDEFFFLVSVARENVSRECACVVIPFILDVRLVDVPAGVTHLCTNELIIFHLLSIFYFIL